MNRSPVARRSPVLSRLCAAVLACTLSLPPAWAQRNALPSLGEGEGISLSAERQLGDRIARELYRDPDYLEDPVLDEYIQRLWAPLIQSAAARGELSPELRERFAWRLLLGRDRSVNAFALPGGYLGVHLGLIAVVSSDDELASVLAHELSHVTQRHIARSMESQAKMTPWMLGSLILGALAASKTPQGAQALIVGGQAAAIQSQLSYTRDMEREADRVGFGVMSEAGYDPRGFVGMFGKLQQAAGINDSGAFPYLRSHPLTTERIADMQGRLQLSVPVGQPSAHEFVQALLAARARVLSQTGVDALRAWISGAQNLSDNLSARERAARLYAASLAHLQLRDWHSANVSMQALEAAVQLRPRCRAVGAPAQSRCRGHAKRLCPGGAAAGHITSALCAARTDCIGAGFDTIASTGAACRGRASVARTHRQRPGRRPGLAGVGGPAALARASGGGLARRGRGAVGQDGPGRRH